MSRRASRLGRKQAAAVLLASAFLALSHGAARARNLALVVGNDAYQNVVKLKTATSDALAVADALEKLGFVVRRAVDVDQRAMSRALTAFDGDLQPGDQAFFFYAGHGLEISGANYILPTDVPAAQANQSELVRDASFPVERVIDGIRERGARVTILVLDACRDNPFASAGTRSAATTGGLARVDAPSGVFVLMSAGAKQEALDRLTDADHERNSVFTRTFLRELSKPGETLVQIAKATQVGVRDLAATIGYEQTPAYYDQIIGDVVLSGPASRAPIAIALAPKLPMPNPEVGRGNAIPLQQQAAASAPLNTSILNPPLRLGGRAPLASFSRSNAGWTGTFSLPEPATEIFYRIGNAGEFKSTGLADALDQRTGERMPNSSFQMPSNAAATIIQVRYQTQDGGSVGPFAILFDPDVMLYREQKRILEQLSSSWVEFREFDGLLIYFTQMVVYRCAISELRYGLNGAAPLMPFDLPSCNPKDPFSVPPTAKLLMKVPSTTKSINLQITWRDGTQSEVSSIERN